ncbi:MAG: protein kinase, partial [Phycisphaerales bacterium]
MKAASTPRAIEIFNDALDVAAGKRAVFLADACGSDETLSGEVESLLDAHDRAAGAAFLDAPNVDRLQSLTEQMLSTPSLVGQRIGPYRVIESLGEGGMGVVYRAEQDHPRRFVALKVMRPGIVNERMLRRFKREVEVLGRLQHPGIARIYDAGVAELPGGTQPYFAMELVTGQPLTTWADAEGLDSRARLALMALVCDAVQHAHQHGVVH